MFRCGLWASSGPFPLSAHYGLYKRGRDPPTNPSRHLKKEKRTLSLSLKWLLKEDQGRRPTAVSAAATAAAPPRAAAMPAAETAASPCLGHISPSCSLPAVAVTAATGRRHCHPRKTAPPLTCRFCASLKYKDDGQTKFIKPNSQRQDIIIKYWVSIGSIHREQG